MRLTWNEIRQRATTFAESWEGHGYEKGQTQLFYQEFFQIFDMSVRRVASFEEPVRRLGDRRGYIDLFWKGVLLVEQKSAGRNLERAREQAFDYFPGIKESDLPQFLLLSDFQSFILIDLDTQEEVEIPLCNLPENIAKFGFILGIQKKVFKDQDPVNIQASELVGEFHDQLEVSGYTGHDLELFLVRLVFCLLADDTGIFEPRDSFLSYLETRTQEDGSDLGAKLSELFQVLNTPEGQRLVNLDEDLAQFPCINGDLFADQLAIPAFNADMRRQLIRCCSFDWSAISPAIFGALFQSVMDAEKRRHHGAHYTTEQNIMKVIEPLFLDDLTAEADRFLNRKDTHRRTELQRFHQKLLQLNFFDPACGCGNFLIIAYREIRRLEMRIIEALRAYRTNDAQQELDAADLSLVNVDQFYGIEIEEFPSRVAETAMWMMDHIMNNLLSLRFGQGYARIPLRTSPTIVHADALDIDWCRVLPPSACNFVFGNPPFSGAKEQTAEQRLQVRRIAALGGSGGTLDYVAAWFIKAADYIKQSRAPIGFVATNSITQGEQVAQLWPILFDRFDIRINFAHQTFAWGSDARGKAHVHVVIIGLDRANRPARALRLYLYDDVGGEAHEVSATAISPYLCDTGGVVASHLVVREEAHPINGLARLIIGSQPIDDGNFIISEDEFTAMQQAGDSAAGWFRPFIGAREFLQGGTRYIVHPGSIPPQELASLPDIRRRMEAVRQYRSESRRSSTKGLSHQPGSFQVTVIPEEPFLAVPEVSSENSQYLPIGWLVPPIIPSNLLKVLCKATLTDFALLTSVMHMTWLRAVGGRLESRYRYSVGVVYNAFPVPEITPAKAKKIEPLAQAVLDARATFPDATLADLYDPVTMPAPLRKAHRALDLAVDRLYRGRKFTSEHERLQHLFERYQAMKQPLV